MKNTAPAGALGYLIASIPERGDWQGFFILPEYAAAGRAMLDHARDALKETGSSVGVGADFAGLPAAEQPVAGTLCATLITFFEMGLGRRQRSMEAIQTITTGISAASWALWTVTGQRWLLVEGRRVPGLGGLETTLAGFRAADIDEAREVLAAEMGVRRGRAG